VVLAADAMALPNAGRTRTARKGGLPYAFEERRRTTRPRTAMAARGHQHTPALDKYGYKVALAPYDLGDPKVEIDVGGEDNSDVARRQGRQPRFLCLYKKSTKDSALRGGMSVH
jgi:hypothetical protein